MTVEEYKKEFVRIISCKTLGTYNYVEKITVFLVNKPEGRTYNYYTIFAFGSSLKPIYKKGEYLTSGLININRDISLGISKSNITIDEAIEQFEELCKKSDEETVDIGEGTLYKGICELIP